MRSAAPVPAALSSIQVAPVATRRELEDFIRLPWTIYRGDPHWVPPLIAEQRKLFDPQHHPFYQHAEVQLFLARRSGQTAGRIAAIINHQHNHFHHDRVGFFGFFESVNAVPVAQALVETAARWLAEQGCTHVRGPANFSTNEECGLLVEGFDSPPMLMMTYNPPWYAGVLEACGLAKAKDLVAYHITRETVLTPRVARLERMVERIKQRGELRVRHFDLKRFDAELALAKRVYNEAWTANWGFVPMTDEEFDYMGRQLRQIAEPELVLLVETVPEGRPVGFSMTLPDWNVALRRIDGRLWPFGLPVLLWYAYVRKTHRYRLTALGVVRDYQRKGVDALLLWESLQRGLQRGFTEAEFSWILEDNALMVNAAEAFGLRCYKRYRLYERAV